MAKIINKEFETMEYKKLIGKKYQGDLNIPGIWRDWFEKGTFDKIDNLPGADSYIGLMRWKENDMKNYEYWIGVFTNDDTPTPDGYESLSINNDKILTYYLQGKDDPDLYALEGPCFEDMAKNNLSLILENDYYYVFERYNCPRFTNPNEEGEVILDYCLLIK